MIIEALSLLLGGRLTRPRPAEPTLRWSGLFVDADDREVVLRAVLTSVAGTKRSSTGDSPG
jgi:hypothetical protein